MIRDISRSFWALAQKGDLLATAAALLLALAVFYFLQALVEGLLAPALAAILGEPGLYTLSFGVNGADFAYGEVLRGLILLALAFLVVALVAKARQAAESRSTET